VPFSLPMSDPSHGIGDILDRLDQAASGSDRVSVGDIREALGQRGQGAFLLFPALIDITPIGSIPGVPTLMAATIILVAVEILIGRSEPWLPAFVERRHLKARTLCKVTSKLGSTGRRLDRWFHGRLCWMTQGTPLKIAAVLIILLALSVPPLELIPLATTAPMSAIAAFGTALLLRDGVLMIAAMAITAAVVIVGAVLLL
jgi:hypothetical protein